VQQEMKKIYIQLNTNSVFGIFFNNTFAWSPWVRVGLIDHNVWVIQYINLGVSHQNSTYICYLVTGKINIEFCFIREE
jgi:hypothetical protein